MASYIFLNSPNEINQIICILFIGQWESRDQKLVISYLSRVKVSDRVIYVAQLTNQIACYIVRWREINNQTVSMNQTIQQLE